MDKDLVWGLLMLSGGLLVILIATGSCSMEYGVKEGEFRGYCEGIGGKPRDNYCWSNDSTILFKKGDKPALPEGE